MSKGSNRRPSQVPQKVYEKNYERVFGVRKSWWETRDESNFVGPRRKKPKKTKKVGKKP